MKTHLYRAALLTGAISFGVAAGWGQTLKVNIPFRFQTANTEMPPGEYSVSQTQAGSPVIALYNRDAHKSALIMSKFAIGASSDARPRMVFHCLEDRCALAQIWGATSGGGVQLWSPRPKSGDGERLAVVYIEGKQAGR